MTDLFDALADKFTVGDGCWEWRATKNTKGYGRVRWEGRGLMAHRVVYELLVGPIPEGLQLDHLCRNRACVNPGHLEPVTLAENIRRGDSGRTCAEKTHCPQGHPYAGENLFRNPKGHRLCRECSRIKARNHWRKGRNQ